MNSFLSIKDWLSLDEAADYLSDKLNTDIRRAELISLVKDKKIKLTANIPDFSSIEITILGLFTTPQKKLPKFKSNMLSTFVHLNLLKDISGIRFLDELKLLGIERVYGNYEIYKLKIPIFMAKKENPIEIADSSKLIRTYQHFKKVNQFDIESNQDFAEKKLNYFVYLVNLKYLV